MRRTAALAAALAIIFAVYVAAPSWGSEAKPGRTETCKETDQREIEALFDRWNNSLQTGQPGMVVANYAEGSVLLPTVSNTPRVTVAEKKDYFLHFLKDRPEGKIDWRVIEIGCNSAIDSGLYTFTFHATGATVKARYTFTYKWDGGKWLITSHHSSRMPEDCRKWKPTKK